MNFSPIVHLLQFAAAAWRRGVPMNVIIIDGWSRGLEFEQTLMECVQAGYSMCIAEPAIRHKWEQMDSELAAFEHNLTDSTNPFTHPENEL